MLTFKSFTEVLRAGLGIHNDEWEAREKLASLSQSASLKTYVRKFLALVNQIQSDPLTGSNKVYRFWSGLKPELRRICMLDPSKQNQIWAAEDFDKLVSFALNIEQSVHLQPDRPTAAPTAKEQKLESPTKPTASASAPAPVNGKGKPSNAAYLVGWPQEIDKPNKATRGAWRGKCWLCMASNKEDKAGDHSFKNCPNRIQELEQSSSLKMLNSHCPAKQCLPTLPTQPTQLTQNSEQLSPTAW